MIEELNYDRFISLTYRLWDDFGPRVGHEIHTYDEWLRLLAAFERLASLRQPSEYRPIEFLKAGDDGWGLQVNMGQAKKQEPDMSLKSSSPLKTWKDIKALAISNIYNDGWKPIKIKKPESLKEAIDLLNAKHASVEETGNSSGVEQEGGNPASLLEMLGVK